VTNLSRPIANLTGFSELNAVTATKRLGILRELIPGAVRFGLLVDQNNSPVGQSVITSLRAAAATTGRQFEVLPAAAEDIDTIFGRLPQKRVDALLVSPSPSFYMRRTQLSTLAARHAIPAIYWDCALVEVGGLMSYGSSVDEMFRQLGIYAGRILKGEKPADLPVQQATKFEFAINLKTARALGLAVPPTLLAVADEVIE